MVRQPQRYEKEVMCSHCTNKFIVKRKDNKSKYCDDCKKKSIYRIKSYKKISNFVSLVNSELRYAKVNVRIILRKSKVTFDLIDLFNCNISERGFKELDLNQRNYNINSELLEARKIYDRCLREYFRGEK